MPNVRQNQYSPACSIWLSAYRELFVYDLLCLPNSSTRRFAHNAWHLYLYIVLQFPGRYTILSLCNSTPTHICYNRILPGVYSHWQGNPSSFCTFPVVPARLIFFVMIANSCIAARRIGVSSALCRKARREVIPHFLYSVCLYGVCLWGWMRGREMEDSGKEKRKRKRNKQKNVVEKECGGCPKEERRSADRWRTQYNVVSSVSIFRDEFQ